MTAPLFELPALLASVVAGAPEPTVPLAREDDRDAVLACQRGEREAFDRLVTRYQREVYRLCYRYVNNHHDANDLAQEAFLRAYRAIGRFRGDSSFSTWLYRIAVNACLNFRSARRQETEELSEGLPDPGAPVVERLQREEESRRVRDAVSRLPEKQRATLILKVYHDLSHEEVAGILGSSIGTVKANLFHALGNLRRLLSSPGAD
jgi:RNA polymerase sigma-70 factor (ECF subfamily)